MGLKLRKQGRLFKLLFAQHRSLDNAEFLQCNLIAFLQSVHVCEHTHTCNYTHTHAHVLACIFKCLCTHYISCK